MSPEPAKPRAKRAARSTQAAQPNNGGGGRARLANGLVPHYLKVLKDLGRVNVRTEPGEPGFTIVHDEYSAAKRTNRRVKSFTAAQLQRAWNRAQQDQRNAEVLAQPAQPLAAD